MSLDLANDLSVVDNAEAITYLQVLPSGNNSIAIPAALRRSPTQAEVALLPPGIALTAGDAVWHLPANALPSITPVAGDQIAAGSQTWTVLSAALQTLGSRWRLYCRLAR